MAPKVGFKHSEESRRKISAAQTVPFEDRFWAKVDKEGPLCARLGSKCWVWTGYTNKGYGVITLDSITLQAHRASFQLNVGDIPPEMEVLHECDNPICINPEHLSLGNHAKNMKDAGDRGLMQSGNNHWSSRQPDKVVKGSELPQAKFTEADIKVIKELLRQGVSKATIARMFNRCQSLISRIASKKIWGHVE